jgi:hypothetical protein
MLIIPAGISFRFNSTLSACDGTPVPLTGAASVVVKIRTGTTTTSLTATVDNASAGILHADATPSDLATVGDYNAWAVATWGDGRVVKSHGLAFRVVAEGTVVQGGC